MNNYVCVFWCLYFKIVNLFIVVLIFFKFFFCYIVNKFLFKEKIEIYFVLNLYIRKYCEMYVIDVVFLENCLDMRLDI